MPYIKKTLLTTEAYDAVHDKRLSISLAADGFSFAVISSQGDLLAFGQAEGSHSPTMTDATRDIKAYFNEVGIRPIGFRRMELTVMSNESVWVPDEVFSPASAREYLKVVGGESRSVLTAQCKTLASTAVYAANEVLVTAFKVALPGLTAHNQHVRMASLVALGKDHPVLLSHWREDMVDLAAFVAGRYVYGNTLRLADESTLRYQLIEVVRTFGLDQSDSEFMMCGDVDRKRYALYQPYFPKVSLYTGCCNVGPEFRQVHTYRYALALS